MLNSLSQHQGVFNPYTLSGTIVVDDVVASAHSDWLLDDICPEKYVGSLPAIYQAGRRLRLPPVPNGRQILTLSTKSSGCCSSTSPKMQGLS